MGDRETTAIHLFDTKLNGECSFKFDVYLKGGSAGYVHKYVVLKTLEHAIGNVPCRLALILHLRRDFCSFSVPPHQIIDLLPS